MIRWYQERNKMPTSAQVRTYATLNGLSMMDAKLRMLDHGPLRLQYHDPVRGWTDAPTVIHERDVPTVSLP